MTLLLRRGLIIVVGVLVAAGMIVMGLWQMARFQSSIADVAAERAAQPAVSLAEKVSPDGTIEDIYGRRVQFSGSVVPGYQLLVGSQWPMRLAVPFEMDDGRILPLVLGVTDTAVQVTDIDHRSLEGIFTAGDQEGQLSPPPDAPEGSTAAFRLQQLVQEWPQPMIAGYVTLTDDDAERYGLAPARPELPEVQGSYMHQGYALQWWVFAAAAVAFSIVIARGVKPRLA